MILFPETEDVLMEAFNEAGKIYTERRKRCIPHDPIQKAFQKLFRLQDNQDKVEQDYKKAEQKYYGKIDDFTYHDMELAKKARLDAREKMDTAFFACVLVALSTLRKENKVLSKASAT